MKLLGDWLGVVFYLVIVFFGFLFCEDLNFLLKLGMMVLRFFNKDVLFLFCLLLVEEYVELEVVDFEIWGFLFCLFCLIIGFFNWDFMLLFLCSFELGCDNFEWDWFRLLRVCFVIGLISGVGGMILYFMYFDLWFFLIVGLFFGLSEIFEYVLFCDVEIILIFFVFLGGGFVFGVLFLDCFWKCCEDLLRFGMFLL